MSGPLAVGIAQGPLAAPKADYRQSGPARAELGPSSADFGPSSARAGPSSGLSSGPSAEWSVD